MKREVYNHSLGRLKSKSITKFDYIGFDVETYGTNNNFLMGGFFYYKGKTEKIPVYKVFWDKINMIKFLFENRKLFERKYIVATNLEFDFTTLFKNTKYWNCFNLLYRGTTLLMVTEKEKHKHGRIKFIDTMNYSPISVSKWGELLGENKLESPSSWEESFVHGIKTIIPKKNLNDEEKKELEIYNKRDCKISCDAMYFLQQAVNMLGGKIKITSASTSLDIFRRNFLNQRIIKESYVLKDESIKDFLFDSYYGGRTEVFIRGEVKDIFYYDINSLYPSVMLNRFPVPQSIQKVDKPKTHLIEDYFGVSDVNIKCPDYLDKPLLPKRIDGKLIFPSGSFRGTFTHAELKKALDLGYKILKINKQVIYTQSFYPFKDFINTLYKLRINLKNDGSRMEKMVKLFMNSLYGRFGMRKVGTTKIMDLNFMSNKEINEEFDEIFEVRNDFGIQRTEEDYNGNCCFPILASYTSSYARLKIYDYLDDNTIYMDTDSIITTNKLPDEMISNEIGCMKLEGEFSRGIFIKPKFYMLENNDSVEVKIKGINKADIDDFFNGIKGGVIKKLKFSRLRESIIRNIDCNSVIKIEKNLSLNDNKRVWMNEFNINNNIISRSKPIKLMEI